MVKAEVMTTHRDAIGLSDRLRQWVTDWDGSQMQDGEPPRDGIHCDIIREAATALDALQGEIRQWANEVARYKAYAEKFEQENDALQARVKELEAENHQLLLDAITNTPLYSRRKLEEKLKTAESRATSAEQERDEALERLKPFAKAGELFQTREPGDYDQCVYAPAAGSEYNLTAGHLRAARDLVRRLAAGTEKEGE